MTLDDVLARVNQARDNVADAIELLNARNHEADALLTDSKTRFDTVHAAFTDLNQHIASESGRVASLTAKLTGVVTDCGTMVQKIAADQAVGFAGLQSRFTLIEQRHGEGDTAITQHETALCAHQDEIVALLDTGKDQMASVRQQFHDSVDHLRATLTGLMHDTDAAVAGHTQTLTHDVSDVSENQVNDLAQQLLHSMADARTAIASLQEQAGSDLHGRVTHVQDAVAALEGRVEDMVHKLSEAIDKLEKVASEIAGTLAHGGEAAAKLMSVTNVGIDQVFKFVEHVRKICEEITSAW